MLVAKKNDVPGRANRVGQRKMAVKHREVLEGVKVKFEKKNEG